MIGNVLTKIFGSRNERLLKQYSRTVAEINAFEPALAALSDGELRAKTPALKERCATASGSIQKTFRPQRATHNDIRGSLRPGRWLG